MPQDITSDSGESEDDQPRRKRVAHLAHFKDSTPAAHLAPVEVIDLTDEVPDSEAREPSIPNNSAPTRRGEWVHLRRHRI